MAEPSSVPPPASPIAERFRAPGPKRILALDGGGTRGIISLAFLEEIERVLQERFKDHPRFRERPLVLADYFDLIGGTSVGSMIATMLALGKPVGYVRERFTKWAPRIFEKKSQGILSHMFDARVLRGLVQAEIFDARLGSADLRTGLSIVTKRIDTGSVWPVINNPFDPYFSARPGEGNKPARRGNSEYALLDLIQASTAAPRYFSPKDIGIFEGDPKEMHGLTGTFVDGAVSPHNSPALLMFMMAGITGYNLGGGELEPRGHRKAWKLGADNLLLVSVGTGTFDHRASRSSASAALDAAYALEGMISDGQQLGLTLLQWMSMPRRNWHIDRVCGDLCHDLLGDGAGLQQPLLSFHRYDLKLENEWLKQEKLIVQDLEPADLERLRDFTDPEAISKLSELASPAAEDQVSADDFPPAFDALWQPPAPSPTPGTRT
jgi:predicted acylesterase/phospholipase RssA